MGTDPATTAQMDYLKGLLEQKQIPEDGSWDLVVKQAYIWLNPTEAHPTRRQASHAIELLKGLPWKPREEEPETEQPDSTYVPEGRYALKNKTDGDLTFWKIDRPTEGRWAGYLFVNQQSGDNRMPVRDRTVRAAILAAIADAGIEASMKLYGQTLGHCAKCGRSLTDPESRAYGIGPECRKGMNLPKPEADEEDAAAAALADEEPLEGRMGHEDEEDRLKAEAEAAIARLNACLPADSPYFYTLYTP